MARPTHRLDLLLVPALDLPIGRGEAWLSQLVKRGVIDGRGRPGPQAAWLGVGRFARVYLDRPPAPTLYANRLGGFHVQCPETDAAIIGPFTRAMAVWRGGGGPTLSCPACRGEHELESLRYRPAAAVGPWAVVAADVDRATWSDEVLAEAEHELGALAVVARRT